MIVYGYKLTDRFKIQIGFFIAAILIIIIPFLSHNPENIGLRFWGTFGVLFIFGAVNGMVQGQVFGLASMLPEKYMGAVMLGNGMSGIVTNLLKVLLLLTLDQDKIFLNEIIFCGLASTILLCCSLGYTVLQNNTFYLYYKNLAE